VIDKYIRVIRRGFSRIVEVRVDVIAIIDSVILRVGVGQAHELSNNYEIKKNAHPLY
jgi:hypothetical protein